MSNATSIVFPHGGFEPDGLNGHASLHAPSRSRPAAALPVTVKALASVADVSREQWDRLFPGAAENWDYFRACERAVPEGFAASAVAAFAGDTLIAAAPLFRLSYRLDMSLQGPLRPIGDWLNKHVPKLVNMPVLGMGSPLTEECPIGLLPGLSAVDLNTAFEALLAGM